MQGKPRGKKLIDLVGMAAADEDALACDFAESYGVLDWRKLPLRQAAALAAGLGDDSRSKRKRSGATLSPEQTLLASLVDGVNRLEWRFAVFTGVQMEPPRSILALLTGSTGDEPENEYCGYDTEEELLAALYPETHSAFLEGVS